MITSALLPMEINAPTIEYGLLAPVLVIFAGACLGVLAEAVVPRELRRVAQLVITFVSLALALATTLLNWASADPAVVAVGSLAIDGPTYFMWTALIVFGAASVLMFAETKIENSSVFRGTSRGSAWHHCRAGGNQKSRRAHRGLPTCSSPSWG